MAPLFDLLTSPEGERLAAEMTALIAELYPLPRSLTGDGVRRTLGILGRELPLSLVEIPSGTPVFDWEVPPEWNVRGATLRAPDGRIVADFAAHNLHLVGYSVPFSGRLSLEQLRPHLHSLPDRPDSIPYRTAYWSSTWGFCLRHRDLASLTEGTYEVDIDTTLAPGHLTYGELVVPGASDDEVLVSSHVCHPSLANDNLSGNAVAWAAARLLAGIVPRFTYRFVFAPGTIGALCWLRANESRLSRIRHGLVLTNVGDSSSPMYKRSRRGRADVDRAAALVVGAHGGQVVDFEPYGYDERQYCSPGFDLPVGCLMRGRHGTFPEYHTSLDDLTFVKPGALLDSLAIVLEILGTLEENRVFLNVKPKGEPRLGARGLYRGVAGQAQPREELALLWLLNQSDGRHSLLDVAERSGLPFPLLHRAATRLAATDLLIDIDHVARGSS